MLLKDYCLVEFYTYHGLKYEPQPSNGDVVVKSSRRYQGFKQHLNSLLSEWQGSVAEALFVLLPAVYAAATKELSDPRTDAEIDEYFSGYAKAMSPLSILRPALDILQRRFFRQVEHKAPSLELGTGDGYASKFIFEDKLTVGSDPLLYSLLGAKRFKGHENYVSLDMTRIPYLDETFNTIYLVHTIDHISDRLDTLREIYRVLRGGGRVLLTDITPYDRELLPLSHIFRHMGVSEPSADAFNHFLDVAGERRMSLPPDYYFEKLADLGFTDIRVEFFMSPQLARTVYLQMELQFLLGYHQDRFRRDSRLRDAYFRSSKKALSPLIANDEALCAEAGLGLNLFVTARKAGQAAEVSAEVSDVSERIVCPVCQTELVNHTCRNCGREYPVIEGMPLLIPFYADAWTEIRDHLPLKAALKRVPGLMHVVRAMTRLLTRLR